jgi:hypothetical protein
MMAPWAETCSETVQPINSVMHSEMWASCSVYCCVWQERWNSYIVLTHNRMHSLKNIGVLQYDNILKIYLISTKYLILWYS